MPMLWVGGYETYQRRILGLEGFDCGLELAEDVIDAFEWPRIILLDIKEQLFSRICKSTGCRRARRPNWHKRAIAQLAPFR